MARSHECCSALSLRRTGDDLHVGLHKGFKIWLAGIVLVSLEFTEGNILVSHGSISTLTCLAIRCKYQTA